VLTLRSGVVRSGTRNGISRMMGNLTSTALMLGVGLMLALLAQSVVGYKVGANW